MNIGSKNDCKLKLIEQKVYEISEHHSKYHKPGNTISLTASLGKAMKWLQQSLLPSPHKQHLVVEGLAVMHKSANAWKLSRPEDKIFYPATQIVRAINSTVAGSQGQFVFENIWSFYIVCQCLFFLCSQCFFSGVTRVRHHTCTSSHNLITFFNY